jgi:hypothetical protein
LRSNGGKVRRLTQSAAGIDMTSGVCKFKLISLACAPLREIFRRTV